MLHLLKRHPVPVSAFFRHSLVLSYAFPQETLSPLLPPGLVLDTYGDFGFLAIAMVQTRDLRPSVLPSLFGQDFFLSGYRIFTRLNNATSLRGLKILRSDTNRRLMKISGNLLTHYNYRHCSVQLNETAQCLDIAIKTPHEEADLEVVADIAHKPADLPAGSPFTSQKDARKFAGPLPYTFDYESQTNSIVMIRGVREHWDPQPVQVEVKKLTFFKREPFCGASPILANAFHLQDVPYRWERGVRVSVAGQ